MTSFADVYRKLKGWNSTTTDREIDERMSAERRQVRIYAEQYPDVRLVDNIFSQEPGVIAAYDAQDVEKFAAALGVTMTPARLPSSQDEIEALKQRVAVLEAQVAALAGGAV